MSSTISTYLFLLGFIKSVNPPQTGLTEILMKILLRFCFLK